MVTLLQKFGYLHNKSNAFWGKTPQIENYDSSKLTQFLPRKIQTQLQC